MRRLLAALLFLAAGALPAHAQFSGVRVVTTCGTPSPWAALQSTNTAVASAAWLTVDNNYNLCTSGGGGGGGGTSSAFGSAFPANGTAAGAEYLSSPPTLTTGQMVALQTDVNGNLKVTGGGSSATFGATFPALGTAAGYEYLSSQPTYTSGQMVAPIVTQQGATLADVQTTNNQLHTDLIAPIAAQLTHTVNIGAVDSISPYPATAVPITASPSNGTTGAIVATLTNVTAHTTYICGFSVRANATAATTVNIVVSGTISGSLNFLEWVAPAASGLGVSEQIFNPCIPASAVSTSIVVTTGAPGSGGATSASAWGYSL
jgi:hypothetical protein